MAALHRVVEEFALRYLADLDAGTRRALDAASVVRRATASLLGAMLPGSAPQDSFDRLRALPFVAVAPDGLVLHETIQGVAAAVLHAADPARYFAHRRAAWRQLRSEVDTVPAGDLWRYTADMLYLIENPVVREAFFPSASQSLSTEPARPEDWPAIDAIIKKHEPPQAAAQLATWWTWLPSSFSVVRDELGTIVAFYCLFELSRLSMSWLDEDPIVAACWRHLRQHPIARGQRTLFLRRWLTLDTGEGPSPGQAACWLDVKRVYMEMRPALGRLYMPIRDLSPYAAVAPRLGFQTWERDWRSCLPVGAARFRGASVDGWLARLAAAELGLTDDEMLDASARQLSIDGKRIDLTRLEYELLSTLRQRQGRFATKEELFNSVWPSGSRAGSNVVEVVVGSLREKLGVHASLIETKRGLGYRMRPAEPS